MISVIVYGRNDSHGYNLPRRAALSLNCIAEVLGAPGDEIIFVDYNTPDQLPSFPEAIADTLTPKARALIRVIRVRHAFHRAHIAYKTHLPVVEPVARNIGLRRADPANAWVLSTNTDMVFAVEGGDLSALVARLKPGLYHAPRFELPEILWEAIDRTDPGAAIRQVSDWGRAFRLEEVVRAGPDAVFDGPGDFQLFPRAAGFEIGGFEEAMLLGWHVDANFGRRMRMKFGRIDEAPPTLRGFHCGHTRETTRYHAAGAVQNDERRFVDAVASPAAVAIEGWGAPRDSFEEIRLGSSPAAAALAAALSIPLDAAPLAEFRLVAETHGGVDYDTAHVLPHLFNLVAHESPATRLGYAGCRADMLTRFAAAWRALPGPRHLLTAQTAAAHDKADSVEEDAFIKTADTFIFEFGVEAGAGDEAAGQALGVMMRLFSLAVEADRARIASGAAPRRFILVNAVHNEIEAAARAVLITSLAPYTTRVRSGFVRDLSAGPAPNTAPPEGRPSERWRGKIAGLGEHSAPLSRAVSAEDFERPSWRAAASRYLPLASIAPEARSDAIWEAVSMLEGADAALSQKGARALLIAPQAELIAAAVANAARLDIADLSAGTERWRTRLALCGAHEPGVVRILTDLTAVDRAAYDAVIIPAETLRRIGRVGAAALLRAACEAAREGARIVFGAYARYARFTGRSTLSASMLKAPGLAAALSRSTPLAPVGPADFRLSDATLDLASDRVGSPSIGAALVRERRGAILARTVWTLEKRRRDNPPDWNRIGRYFAIGV